MLALALIKNPPDTEKHLQRHGSSIMLSVNYHLPPVDSEDDPIIVGVMKHVERIMHETRPGTRLVEFFTWMRYIPSRCVCVVVGWGYFLTCVRACGERFAKWKRDAEYWFVQDTLTFERLLGKVTNDLVCTYGPHLTLSPRIEVVNFGNRPME